MAKITPSSLITAIQGKFNSDIFQLWKTAIVRRRSGKPMHLPTLSRARFHGIVSDISGRWDSLSSAVKDGWDSFAGEFTTQLSGFNSFMQLNVALVYADHPGLCYYSSVLTCYFIPPIPNPVSVFWLSGSLLFCVSWTTPACLSQFAQAFFAPQTGYSNLKFPKLRLGKTEVSSLRALTIDGSDYPSGTIIRFQVRSIDSYGMTSAYSNVLSCTRG